MVLMALNSLPAGLCTRASAGVWCLSQESRSVDEHHAVHVLVFHLENDTYIGAI